MKIIVTHAAHSNPCKCQLCDKIIAAFDHDTMKPSAEECYRSGNVPVPNFGWFCSQQCASDYETTFDIKFEKTIDGKVDYYMMTENNRIEIALSKSKLTKLLTFSILFLLGGIWMILSNPHTNNALFDNPIVKAIAGYGSVLMGILGIYFFTKKLLDKKPGLVLSEQGIYDNTSAFKFGLIPWSDITGVHEKSIQASISSKQYFVTIVLVNPNEYISGEPNFLKRKLLAANYKTYGSPVHISTNGLMTNHEDLLKLISEYFEKYKQPE